MNREKASAERAGAATAQRTAPPQLVLTGDRIRVGIVEDDEAACDLMSRVMRLSGLDVTEFHDCMSAQVSALSERLDAYIVDWRVGATTSERLVRQLCSMSPDQRPVIVMLSGHIHDDGRTEDEALGKMLKEFDLAFRAKPYAPRKLAEEVSAMVRTRLETWHLTGSKQTMTA